MLRLCHPPMFIGIFLFKLVALHSFCGLGFEVYFSHENKICAHNFFVLKTLNLLSFGHVCDWILVLL
jgi:hypothetical protein